LIALCSAGGVHNIEVRRVDIALDRNQLNNLQNNAWNKALTIDCRVTLLGAQYPGKLEIHGASSRGYPKKSFEVKFAKADAPKINLYNYVGDKEEKIRKIVLNAAWVDATFMRNKLTWDLHREIGGLAPRVVWCELYFNGEYQGFYLLGEPVGDEFWNRHGWNDKDETVNVYKSVSHDGNFFPKPNPLTGYDKKSNEKGSSADIGTLLNVLERTPKNFAEFERVVQPVVNIRDWFQYLFTCVFANNIDGYDKNYYLYHDLSNTSPIRVVPWDSDATWGNSWNGYPERPGSSLWGGDGMSARVFSIPEYTYSYLSNFKCLMEQGPLQRDKILDKVNTIAEAIKSYVAKDEAKWFPVGRIDNRAFALEVQDIRNYVTARSRDFFGAVNTRLQGLINQGQNTDRVVKADGTPYFACGAVPLPKKIKKEKEVDNNDNNGNNGNVDNPPPPPPPKPVVHSATVCQGSGRALECPVGSTVTLNTVTYGRTDSVTCVAPNIGNTNCRADVTARVREICTQQRANGQSHLCNLNANNNDLGVNPCAGIQKYMTVSYTCVSAAANAAVNDNNMFNMSSGQSPAELSPAVITAAVVSGIVGLGMVFFLLYVFVYKHNTKQAMINEARP